MPEDRGLYQDIPLDRCLTYFGRLKGLNTKQINTRLESWLEKFDLTVHRKKKVKELSKGMQQKAQIIATLIHGPELIIIDEPFTALDPVNTQMIKDLLRSERDKGRTILMSTHQMHQVEELCDRILLVNEGKDVLYGKLAEIRKRFASHAVLVRSTQELPEVRGVIGREYHNGASLLRLDEKTTPQAVLTSFVNQGVQLEQFEVAAPDLDEIFIQVVSGEHTDEE
jgi:ABC-2 type transport system ATP-binding protein